MNAVTKLAPKPAAAFDGGKGCLRIVASSEVPDRDDEVVVPGLLRLDEYRSNPIVLGFHDQKSLPIAKCESPDGTFTARLDPTTGDLLEDWYFARTPEGATFARLYQDRILRGASVGFKPDGLDSLSPDESRKRYGVYKRLAVYTGGTVFETSAVPLPSCPRALSQQWVDLDALGSVMARRSIGDDKVSALVAKSFAPYLPRRKTFAARILSAAASGFPAGAGQYPHNPTRGSAMSQATETEKTDAAAVVKDMGTAEDTAGGSAVDGPDMADPHANTKAGAMADMLAHIASFGNGEMDWKACRGYLDEKAKIISKLVGAMADDGEPDGDEAGEMKAEDDNTDGDVETGGPDGGTESLEDEEEKAAFLDLVRKAVRDELAPVAAKVGELEAVAEATVSALEILKARR